MDDWNIQAVLFDFDGTLTRPGALDFPAIKKALGCPLDQPILEYVQAIATPYARKEALEQLDRFEILAARRSKPNDGAVEIVRWLKDQGLPVGIITRNSRASVLTALAHFAPLGVDDFDVLVTRDDPPAPKPSGQGVHWAARHLRTRPEAILMVGDYLFDCEAGRSAGARTALLDPHNDPRLEAAVCDVRLRCLDELKGLVRSSG
jgi:HAD superfamily hydrolase (TIGR01509 family)